MSTHAPYPPNHPIQLPYPGPPEKKGMAIAAMVIGIVAIVLSFIPVIGLISFVLGPLAVILGIVALVQNRGRGQAIAGLVTGAVGFVIVLTGTLIFGALLSSVDDEIKRQEALEQQIEQNTQVAIEDDADVDDTEEQTAKEKAPAEKTTSKWVKIASLSGKGDQRGKTFTINNDARLTYKFNAANDSFAIGGVYLMPKGQVLTEDGGIPEVTLSGSESGETMVYQTGEVYIEVIAANFESWTVTVEERQ